MQREGSCGSCAMEFMCQRVGLSACAVSRACVLRRQDRHVRAVPTVHSVLPATNATRTAPRTPLLICPAVRAQLHTYKMVAMMKKKEKKDQNQELYTVAYTSNLLMKTDIAPILIAAVTHNPKKEISGILWFDDKTLRCVQILEGPRGEIKALLARIAADPRHNEFKVLYQHAVQERQYPKFGMMNGTDTFVAFPPRVVSGLLAVMHDGKAQKPKNTNRFRGVFTMSVLLINMAGRRKALGVSRAHE